MPRKLMHPSLSVLLPNKTKMQNSENSRKSLETCETVSSNEACGLFEVKSSILAALDIENIVIPSQNPASIDILSFKCLNLLDICESILRVNQAIKNESRMKQLKRRTKNLRSFQNEKTAENTGLLKDDFKSNTDSDNIEWFVRGVLEEKSSQKELPILTSSIPQSSSHARISNALIRKWSQIAMRRNLLNPSILNWKKDQDTNPMYVPLYLHPLAVDMKSFVNCNHYFRLALVQSPTESLSSQITLTDDSNGGKLSDNPETSQINMCNEKRYPGRGILKIPSFELDSLDKLVKSFIHCATVIVLSENSPVLQHHYQVPREQVINELKNNAKYNPEQSEVCPGEGSKCTCVREWKKRFVKIKSDVIKSFLQKFWRLQLDGKAAHKSLVFQTPSLTVSFSEQVAEREFSRSNREYLESFGKLPRSSHCYLQTKKRGNIPGPGSSEFITIERPKTSSLIRQSWRSMILDFFSVSVISVIPQMRLSNYETVATRNISEIEKERHGIELNGLRFAGNSDCTMQTDDPQVHRDTIKIFDDLPPAHGKFLVEEGNDIEPEYSSGISTSADKKTRFVIATAFSDITDKVAMSTACAVGCVQGIAENVDGAIVWASNRSRDVKNSWTVPALQTIANSIIGFANFFGSILRGDRELYQVAQDTSTLTSSSTIVESVLSEVVPEILISEVNNMKNENDTQSDTLGYTSDEESDAHEKQLVSNGGNEELGPIEHLLWSGV